jgi:Flp pilus assembly pilin Flp
MTRAFLKAQTAECGQDLIEYSIFAGLIAAALIAATMLVITGAVQDMSVGIAQCIDWNDATHCTP